MRFIRYTLEPLTDLHLGAGRAGMVMRNLGFVPGHLVGHALASVLGAARGARPEDFASALKLVRERLRLGPAFLIDDKTQVLTPRRHRREIEERHLHGRTQVALDSFSRSAADGALFEVESLSARVLSGTQRGQLARLAGGLWCEDEKLDGIPLRDWFNRLWLGGERKSGHGRVRVVEKGGWAPNAAAYPGIVGTIEARGIRLDKGVILPGPACDGVEDAPLRPWVGRLHDPVQGFGRRLSPPVLVRMDGRVTSPARFQIEPGEAGWCCWRTLPK